jgi:DNA-binding MarR family transcriptional regulator
VSSTLSPGVTTRLGYLLKHAREQLSELTATALEPYGVDGRQVAVLLVLADGEPTSQQAAAGRLGIDRTSMVGLLDVLEGKGLVARRPDTSDRRRNVVALTPTGRDTLARATQACDAAEREFLRPLTPELATQLTGALRTIVGV